VQSVLSKYGQVNTLVVALWNLAPSSECIKGFMRCASQGRLSTYSFRFRFHRQLYTHTSTHTSVVDKHSRCIWKTGISTFTSTT